MFPRECTTMALKASSENIFVGDVIQSIFIRNVCICLLKCFCLFLGGFFIFLFVCFLPQVYCEKRDSIGAFPS